MMIEILITATLRTLLLSLIVALGLRALHVRHAQLLLAAWTAVLVASLLPRPKIFRAFKALF